MATAPRRGYHHGNLREALIQAALDLIAEKGPAGFTFVDAARAAGVSPAAPYRHFRDRDELMAGVAQRGFEQFEAALARAWDDGRPDHRHRFRAGRQGLSCLRPRPSRRSIRRCSKPASPVDANPDLQRPSERAFGVLRRAPAVLCWRRLSKAVGRRR